MTLPEPPGALRTQTALPLLVGGGFVVWFLAVFTSARFTEVEQICVPEVTPTGGGSAGSAGEAEKHQHWEHLTGPRKTRRLTGNPEHRKRRQGIQLA